MTRKWALALVVVCSTKSARADPGQSSWNREWTEFTPVPLVGGDSDIGIGGGALVSVARVSEIRRPYLWRLEAFAMTTFKSIDGDLKVPFQDYYLYFIMPHVVPNRLEMQFRLSYTKMNLSYFGVGNASPLPADPDNPFFRFERTHPTARARAIYRFTRFWQLEFGLAYTQNWVDVPRPSKLRDDALFGPQTVRDLLDGFKNHAVFTNSYGVWFDNRDDKVSPRLGQLHTLRVDLSPGGTELFPYRWTRIFMASRFYVPLTRRAVFGTRLVVDALTGQAPFYELARYDETFAIGGAKGVRGVPAQRYQGELKVFGNAELRLRVVNFEFLNKSNQLGTAMFFDAGRVWATYASNPDLDGTALGLKFGMGFGLRVLAGRSFVIRADLAWSPDARPVAAYFVAGHMF